ncbi:NEDD8 ultimate buster 1 [Fundulus heteroclitus]|uniref:NEDD8 ultimate buster 1 n=1 Tax=Fundulus heteroclitus TaxID=8078 RepID=UPI00165CDCC8|nr:NEDD8 ultimate buster 1 [Fundulus heteroclitus]XP_021168474.2 NEDD8 ultimate buster 1 [Fundulus heteroclitus]XP_021168475.2 NEDD8 ultimate buster 1 [Fundulus heteroclitus]
MTEQNTQAKLKNLLKQEKIQLWNPPYTQEDNQPGDQHLLELAQRYAPLLHLPAAEVGGALESIRIQAVRRGKGNQTFRETSVATLELLLPRDAKQEPKRKNYLETRLDLPVQQLVDRITEEFSLKHIKLILNGRTLSTDQRLDEQGVKNHCKVMVLKVSDAEQITKEEEEKKNQSESIQRTQKGFQILSERDGSEDPDTTPFLEIADQKGNPLKIPHKEKKALILAMGFHEKGRSLMKRKQYDNALCHLLQADQQFSKCGSALLGSVDNYAVLQLDVVWCYRALEALSCLEDSRSRLQRAEECFLKCYGEQQQRLLMIKGNTGREEVLFLRLYLLQSLLSYIEGNDRQALVLLSKVENLYGRLSPDSEKMAQLMALGFTEREARLGLRACGGDLQEAAIHISNRRQEREELKQSERQKRRTRMEAISRLEELGFSRRDAARALHHAGGDVDKAYAILQDSSQAAQTVSQDTVSPEKVEQLLYLGFEREAAEAALRLTGEDVQSATQLLLDNQGVLSPDLLSPDLLSPPSTSTSPSSEEASTSSTSPEDNELVNEVLEDISRHEEDYLDLTLEEESELISRLKTYLNREPAHTV